MSKLVSIILSPLILFQSFGISFDDIAQIDEFIEHAQFHSEKYGDNVFIFISKHYGELKADHDKDHQEEKEDHEQLPFQQQSQAVSVVALLENTEKDDLKELEFLEFKSHNFFYQIPLSSLYSDGPFQPPRQS